MSNTNDKRPTLKPGNWTDETVAEAARKIATQAGMKPNDIDAFIRTTVRKWQMGDATVATHDWPK